MNDEQIERVARALYPDAFNPAMPEKYLGMFMQEARKQARAAITAMDGQTATPAEAALSKAKEVLTYYENTFCEGLCLTLHVDYSDDECSGCLARSALRAIAQEGE